MQGERVRLVGAPISLPERATEEDDPDGHRESSPSQPSLTTALAVEPLRASAPNPLARLATS
jgi:hypothetical protein